MPRSWLIPAVAVHRSALPPITACAVGVCLPVTLGGVPSIVCQVLPLFPVSWYWLVLTAKSPRPTTWVPAATKIRPSPAAGVAKWAAACGRLTLTMGVSGEAGLSPYRTPASGEMVQGSTCATIAGPDRLTAGPCPTDVNEGATVSTV